MVDNVIILAGGSGTRLWPASIAAQPKQFLDPGTGRSLLQMTIERAAAVAPDREIAIVTHVSQAPEVERQCRALVELRDRIVVLPEPEMRNTAPALALGLAWFSRDHAGGDARGQARAQGDATTLVLASDHMITPVDAFARDVEKADQLAREGFLVVFGVPPTRPETGYGYIEAGDPRGPGRLVTSFREKPDAPTAEEYLRRGTFSWNSGMFVFRRDVLLGELARFQPEITRSFDELRDLPAIDHEGVRVVTESERRTGIYRELPRISVDYAVMERSRRVAMVETTFQWNDIGSWDEMAQLTAEGVLEGTPVYGVEAAGNYVYADQPVVLCGVEDLIVVVRNGRVLVTHRGKSQLVKDAVDRMRAEGRDDLL